MILFNAEIIIETSDAALPFQAGCEINSILPPTDHLHVRGDDHHILVWSTDEDVCGRVLDAVTKVVSKIGAKATIKFS